MSLMLNSGIMSWQPTFSVSFRCKRKEERKEKKIGPVFLM
jgi:hypothetical protein